MVKKTKGMNNAIAKNSLVNTIELVAEKKDMRRRANSEEGQLALIREKTRCELEERKAQFAINQLVWKDVIANDESLMTSGRIVNQANRITEIDDDGIFCEMLYIVDEGIRFESYMDSWETTHEKGESKFLEFYRLERHVAKSTGNIWWKVK